MRIGSRPVSGCTDIEMGLAPRPDNADPRPAWSDFTRGRALLWIAAHHILAKGALFLTIGVVAATRAAPPWLVLFPATVLALGMGGFPLTGSALAKLRT